MRNIIRLIAVGKVTGHRLPRRYLQGSVENRNETTTFGDGVTMTNVKSRSPSFSRRKLSAVVRKAITSYYTAQEQQEIARAAERQGISMSSFVATASLAEARRTQRKH